MKIKKLGVFFAAVVLSIGLHMPFVSAKQPLDTIRVQDSATHIVAPDMATNTFREEDYLLLQGAMESEIFVLREAMTDVKEFEIAGFRFWTGRIGKQNIVLSQTGIGTAKAAAATTIACLQFAPQRIINQGTAGGYLPDIEPFDLVIGTEYFNANAMYMAPDEAHEAISYLSLADLEGEDAEALATKNGIYTATSEPLTKWLVEGLQTYRSGNVYEGCIASSDQWNASQKRITEIAESTNAICEEMEVGAVGTVAAQFGIPFTAVRVISNNNRTGKPFNPQTAVQLQKEIIGLLGRGVN